MSLKTEMWARLKCEQNWNVSQADVTISEHSNNWNVQKKYKTKISLAPKCHLIWNATKTEMSPTLNWTKTEMWPKLKCDQNWNFNKAELSPKLKYNLKWNVTKTDISLKLKCHKNSKIKILICHKNWNVAKTESVSYPHATTKMSVLKPILFTCFDWMKTTSPSRQNIPQHILCSLQEGHTFRIHPRGFKVCKSCVFPFSQLSFI